MPREGTKTRLWRFCTVVLATLRLNMPREGTKTNIYEFFAIAVVIEIKYAPGGDENAIMYFANSVRVIIIEIKYAPGGDENSLVNPTVNFLCIIEIKYAPGGDENSHNFYPCNHRVSQLRLDMPREGTKTICKTVR